MQDVASDWDFTCVLITAAIDFVLSLMLCFGSDLHGGSCHHVNSFSNCLGVARRRSNSSMSVWSVLGFISVHGTWVSGRIEPLVRVKLNESDMLHLGASSRMYKLNWVPLSRAYDMDDPFMPQLDIPDKVDDETNEVIDQDHDSMSCRENQGQYFGLPLHFLFCACA